MPSRMITMADEPSEPFDPPVVAALRAEVERLARENGDLRAENARLGVQNDELRGEGEPKVAPDGATSDECLAYLLECASCWSPDARLVGNLRAGDIVRSLRDWHARLAGRQREREREREREQDAAATRVQP